MKYQSYSTGANRSFSVFFLTLSKIWHIGGWKSGYSPAMCSCIPESQPCPGMHPKQCVQQGRGRDFAPLLHSGETPAGVLCPAVQTSVQGRHEPENILGWEFLFPVEKLKKLGLFSLEKIPGRLYCSLSLLIRDRQERWG